MSNEPARLKLLYISPQMFIEFCKYGADKVKVVSDALPEDTIYVRAFADDKSGWGRIGIVVESSSFDELKNGDEIPTISPMFEKVI